MSKLFYDHLIILEEVEIELSHLNLERDERRELEKIIENLVHQRVINRILTHLPKIHHREFLNHFTKTPHDPFLLRYLDERIKESVEKHIGDEIQKVRKELLADIQQKTPKRSSKSKK